MAAVSATVLGAGALVSALAPAVAGTALVLGPSITSYMGYQEQKKASKRSQALQEKANRVEQARAAVNSAAARRRAVAQARIAAARNLAMAGTMGMSGSVIGGANASLLSGLGSNFGVINSETFGAQQAFDLRNSAGFEERRGQTKAQMWSAYGQGIEAVTKVGTAMFTG